MEHVSHREAAAITKRLQKALENPRVFSAALYQLGTPTDIEVLEVLIGTTNHLKKTSGGPEPKHV